MKLKLTMGREELEASVFEGVCTFFTSLTKGKGKRASLGGKGYFIPVHKERGEMLGKV